MVLKKIIWGFTLLLFLGGSTVEMACSRKSTLQKKTMAYKKKMRKGKSVPCPCNE
jgi:hypothetical protein